MTYSNDWVVTDNPADHSKFKDQPSFIRKIRLDLEERLADLFYGFTSGETSSGVKQLSFGNQYSDPSAPTDAIVLFAKKAYVFTVSGITTMPTAGATYTNNSKTFTVLYTSATQIYCSGTGDPAASGNLTKASGTGDATIAFSAMTSKSEIYTRHESAGVKLLTSIGKIVAATLTSLATIAADAGIIPIANLASGTPDGTKFIRDDGTLQIPFVLTYDKMLSGSAIGYALKSDSTAFTMSAYFPGDGSVPQISEGQDYAQLAQSYDCKVATSKVLLEATIPVSHGNDQRAEAAIFVEGVDAAIAVGLSTHGQVGGANDYIVLRGEYSPGVITSKNYKVRISGSAAVNPQGWIGGVNSSFKITEIKQ